MTPRSLGTDPWWLTAVRWPLWSWQRLLGTVAVFVVVTSAASLAHDRIVRLGGSASGVTTELAARAAVVPTGSPGAATTAGAAASSASGTGGTSGPPGADTSGSGTALAAPGAPSPAEPSPSPSGPVSVEQSRAAWQFVADWARPDQPASDWFAALEPLSTTRLAALLKQTDPGRVPATKVLDPSPAATTATASTAADQVPNPTPSVAAAKKKATKKARPSPSPSAAAPTASPSAVLPFGATQAVTVRTDGGAVLVGLLYDGSRWLVDSIAPTGQPG